METATINKDTPVGRVAAMAPLATRVFARHGIDFCCGGGVPLAEACAKHELQVDDVLQEIHQVLSGPDKDVASWDDAPLNVLIDHIEAVYHRPLDEELPRIQQMAEKVFQVHGDKDPEMLGGILQTFTALKAELEPHMMKEEQVLFPMIKAGNGAFATGPVQVMQHEHEEAGAMLRRLNELTHGYTVPEGACNTWTALWHALADLERSLHEHIHLENNILFPRALGS
jgi:regulator of cell morphogenesis and NO signaling